MGFKKISLYLGISLLAHLIFLLILFSNLIQDLLKAIPEKEEPKKITLNLIEPTPELQSLFEQKKFYADSSQSIKTEEPDPNTIFEGAENTKASSPTQGDGNKFMPNVDGADVPGQDIVDTMQSKRVDSNQSVATTQNQQKIAEQPPRNEQLTEPTQPRPKASEALPLRQEGMFRSSRPTENQKDVEEKKETKPFQTSGAQGTQKSQNTPPPSSESLEIRANKLRGGADEIGAPSFAINATSKGAYLTRMMRAIEYRWKVLIDPYISLHSVGIVTIKFDVTSQGVITNVRVISGEEHFMNAQYATQSIREVGGQLPPFPEDMIEELMEEQGHADYFTKRVSFTIYNNY